MEPCLTRASLQGITSLWEGFGTHWNSTHASTAIYRVASMYAALPFAAVLAYNVMM